MALEGRGRGLRVGGEGEGGVGFSGDLGGAGEGAWGGAPGAAKGNPMEAGRARGPGLTFRTRAGQGEDSGWTWPERDFRMVGG